jgi:hypothetical protein
VKVNAANFFKIIDKEPDQFFIIHYSSQSLYDTDSRGFSPRITSIAVMHFANQQTESFSVHATAELLRIPRDQVESRYDDIEKEMLRRFFDFLRDGLDRYWITWRMQNLTFGFEHLEHRWRYLGESEPPILSFEHRLDLSAILQEKYGRDYVANPRMMNLVKMNGTVPQGFLTGEQEAEAFKRQDFIRMHASTLAKVNFFRHVIVLAQRGRLKTASRSWGVRVDRLLESRSAKLAALIAAILGVIGVSLYQLFAWLH